MIYLCNNIYIIYNIIKFSLIQSNTIESNRNTMIHDPKYFQFANWFGFKNMHQNKSDARTFYLTEAKDVSGFIFLAQQLLSIKQF